jgi:ADP-heptose:LPS heptosyltransferase
MYRVVVPSGIGDFSWMWNKLSTIKDATWEIYVPDSYPQRTKQYIDLLPNAKGMLGNHDYRDIITWGSAKGAKTWEQTVKNFGDGEYIYLQANEHLGQGRLLEDWMPDLGSDFHYKFNFNTKEPHFLDPDSGPYMTIHMASMRGIRAWKAWMPESWVAFFELIHKDFPDFTFVLMGGIWDEDTALEVVGLSNNKFNIIDLTGRTKITDAIRVIDNSIYYVGYSSGLGVIANVLNVPSVSLWPVHQAELMYSWPDPETVRNRDYMGFVYDAPERIYNRIKPKLKEVVSCRTGTLSEAGKKI